jgi:nucleoside-diphosphate-sugar epimerase
MTPVTQIPPLVTIFGGSGFIGRHLVQALARRGYRIRVGRHYRRFEVRKRYGV